MVYNTMVIVVCFKRGIYFISILQPIKKFGQYFYIIRKCVIPKILFNRIEQQTPIPHCYIIVVVKRSNQ